MLGGVTFIEPGTPRFVPRQRCITPRCCVVRCSELRGARRRKRCFARLHICTCWHRARKFVVRDVCGKNGRRCLTAELAQDLRKRDDDETATRTDCACSDQRVAVGKFQDRESRHDRSQTSDQRRSPAPVKTNTIIQLQMPLCVPSLSKTSSAGINF